MFELVERLGIEILGRAEAQFLGSQVTNGAAVHCVVDGTGRGNDLNALFFELKEALGTDGLNLRDDDVGLMLTDNCLESIAIQHRKNFALIGHLHGRSIIIAVASDDILAGTFGGNHKLFAQFA